MASMGHLLKTTRAQAAILFEDSTKQSSGQELFEFALVVRLLLSLLAGDLLDGLRLQHLAVRARKRAGRRHGKESSSTLLVVAASLVVLLGVSALAIDLLSL